MGPFRKRQQLTKGHGFEIMLKNLSGLQRPELPRLHVTSLIR